MFRFQILNFKFHIPISELVLTALSIWESTLSIWKEDQIVGT